MAILEDRKLFALIGELSRVCSIENLSLALSKRFWLYPWTGLLDGASVDPGNVARLQNPSITFENHFAATWDALEKTVQFLSTDRVRRFRFCSEELNRLLFQSGGGAEYGDLLWVLRSENLFDPNMFDAIKREVDHLVDGEAILEKQLRCRLALKGLCVFSAVLHRAFGTGGWSPKTDRERLRVKLVTQEWVPWSELSPAGYGTEGAHLTLTGECFPPWVEMPETYRVVADPHRFDDETPLEAFYPRLTVWRHQSDPTSRTFIRYA